MKTILACLILGSSIAYTSAHIPPPNLKAEVGVVRNDTTPVYQMKQYWLVLLYKGANRNQDSLAADKIQKAHMSNIGKLASEGKIIMAGPMGYNRDLRGIFIMDAPDSATAAGYVQTDSAIITGRMRFEVHPWWTAKGSYQFK